MRVLMLVPSIKAAGPINVVLSIICEARKNNIDILLVEIRESEESSYKNILQSYMDRKIVFLGRSSFGGVSKFKKIINNFKPDVIHSHGFFPDLYNGFLARKKIVRVSTCHNVIHEDYTNVYGFLKGRVFSKIHYYTYKFCIDAVIGCSNTVSKNIVDHLVHPGKVFTIYNGVNIEKFCPISEDEKNDRKKNEGFLSKDIYVYCGGLDVVKRVPDLIKIFQKKKCNDSILIILGDGVDLKKCVQAVKGDNIILKGRVSNPEYYLQMGDYVVSNSSSEGYPLAILEAIACGCSAFLSEIPAHLEILEKYPDKIFSINLLLKTINNIGYDDFNFDSLGQELMAKQYFRKYIELSIGKGHI
ncbi:glycosyltransferase [Acinetobacter junii]|uniref:glycosyltransferase n=1 Tax=Acinetobacter junii TaxID=40215 RepID=UPI0032B5587F